MRTGDRIRRMYVCDASSFIPLAAADPWDHSHKLRIVAVLLCFIFGINLNEL
jgi:hypothetical protein